MLRISDRSFRTTSEPFLHPGKSADVHLAGSRIGYMGTLSPEVTERLDIVKRSEVLVFEFDLNELLSHIPVSITYRAFAKYPPVERDIAIILEKGARSSDVMELIRAYPGEFIEDVNVFDSYMGKNIPGDRKSLAFSVTYRSPERTLTDEEVDAVHKGLVDHLIRETGGEVRRG
jgi:phenylalanyl-tRNA synthetase beta chain